MIHVPVKEPDFRVDPAAVADRINENTAAIVYLGEEGYLKSTSAIMAVADEIKKGIQEMPELTLIGQPTFVISFRSDAVDVFHINDFMKTKGWHLKPNFYIKHALISTIYC